MSFTDIGSPPGFVSQADLKKALDDGKVDAIVVYYCGSEFSQDEYTAVRSIRFPQHNVGIAAFWKYMDQENKQIRGNEDDEEFFQCLKKVTRAGRRKNRARGSRESLNHATGGKPRSNKTSCRQTFTGAHNTIRKKDWMYVLIGSAALLVFLLGVGALYSWQVQRATGIVHGKPRTKHKSNTTHECHGSIMRLFLFMNATTRARDFVQLLSAHAFSKQTEKIQNYNGPTTVGWLTLSSFSPFPTN